MWDFSVKFIGQSRKKSVVVKGMPINTLIIG